MKQDLNSTFWLRQGQAVQAQVSAVLSSLISFVSHSHHHHHHHS
jgi:hypothetical protein